MKAKHVAFSIVLSLLLLMTKEMVAQQYAIPTDLFYQFMRHNDSRSIGMGSTGASYVTGIMSGYTNPAGLTGLGNYTFALSYYPSNSFDWYDQYGVSIGLPLPVNIKSGLYYTYFDMGESGGNSTYQLSLARTFYHIAFGASVRYMSQSLNSNIDFGPKISGYGWFFDIGIRYNRNLFSNQNSNIDFHVGGTIYNLGPSSRFKKTLSNVTIKGKEPHARVVQYGLALKADFLKESDHAIKPEIVFSLENRRLLNTNYYEKWNYMISGGELKLFEMALVRLGYYHRITGYYNKSGWSYGVGFETKKPLSEKLPVRAGLSYSRSLKIGLLRRDVFQMELNYLSE